MNNILILFKRLLGDANRRVEYDSFVFAAQQNRRSKLGEYMLSRNFLAAAAVMAFAFLYTGNKWMWLGSAVLVVLVFKRYSRSRFKYYDKLHTLSRGKWNDEKEGAILGYGKLNTFLREHFEKKIAKRNGEGGFNLLAFAVAGALFFGCAAPARAGSDYGYGSSGRGGGGPIEIAPEDLVPVPPQNGHRPPGVKSLRNLKSRFEMDMDPKLVRQIQEKRDRYRRMMNRTYGIAVNEQPDVRPFKAMDDLELSSEFTTTLLFPKGYAISAARASEPMALLKFSENSLTIKPTRKFLEGTLDVYLSSGEDNRFVKIHLLRYMPQKADSEGERHYLDTLVVYKNDRIEDPVKILQAYFRLNGEDAIYAFDEDGDYDVINIGTTPYYIIRDDRFGTIEYRHVNFRIAHRAVPFAEQIGGK